MRGDTMVEKTENDRGHSSILFVLLCVVVLSSLSLIPLGLKDPYRTFEVLHVPTLVAQILFLCVVAVQPNVRSILAMMPRAQLLSLIALFSYVYWVSVTSPIDFALFLGMFWLVHILFLVALIVFYRTVRPHGEDPIWMILGVAGLLHLIAFLIAWAFWPDNVRQTELPAFVSIRHLGYFMAPVFAATATLFLTRKNNLFGPFICFSAAAFYIIYTGSRGGAVATFAGMMLIGFFAKWHGKGFPIQRVGMLVAAIGALMVLCEFLPPLPWPALFSRAVEVAGETGADMLTGRDELWKVAWLVIKDNWLFGAGPSWLVHVVESPQFATSNPHNIILQLLSQWGVVGTLLVLITVLTFARNLLCALTLKPEQALVPAAVLLTMCVHSLVSGNLYHTYTIAVAIIAFASLVRIGWQVPPFGK